MWQFSEVIDGLAAACNALETPITGGNVSFYNETLGTSIYPTPVIGILGVIEDAANVLKLAFPKRGRHHCFAGRPTATDSTVTAACERSTDPRPGANFLPRNIPKPLPGIVAGQPPAIDLAAEKRLQQCLVALAASGRLQSAHDISDGGLAVTLAESCFAASVYRRADDTEPQ